MGDIGNGYFAMAPRGSQAYDIKHDLGYDRARVRAGAREADSL